MKDKDSDLSRLQTLLAKYQQTSIVSILYSGLGRRNTVFCPGFQKGRVPSEKGHFSAVNGPSKGHFSAVN